MMKHLQLIFFFLYFLVFGGCASKMPYKERRDWYSLEFGESKLITIDLAREKCQTGYFDFCSDDMGQIFRVSPLFVVLDTSDYFSSYDTVYLIPSSLYLEEEKIQDLGVDYSDISRMEAMFADSLILKEFSFNNKSFNRKVKRRALSEKIFRNYLGQY